MYGTTADEYRSPIFKHFGQFNPIRSNMEFIPSQRGKLLLTFEGFVYKKDRARENKTYWKCADDDCRGRAVTFGIPPDCNECRVTKEHSHLPDSAIIEAKKGFARAKVAAQGHGSTAVIFNEEISAKIPLSAQGALPKEASIKRRIQRERRKHFPSLPETPADIDISGKWCLTNNNEDWLIYDNMIGDQRILIFATHQNLQTLSLSKVWYGDGTFDVTPPLFAQLYTIHCEYLGRVLPQVFCLLPGKSALIYETMFLAIRDKMCETLPGFEPDVDIFRLDFELAAHLAAKSVFPTASIECCFFHFGQANWRHLVNTSGLRQRYIEDTDFALQVRMFTALAFLPDNKIKDAFGELKDAAPDELEEFSKYFERTYIGYYKSSLDGTRMRLVWKAPLFSPEKWSVYNRILQDDPRTTNFLEAWHRRFSTVVGASHPNIYKFLETLCSEQSHTELRKVALLRGEVPKPPKKREMMRNQYIMELVKTFETRPVMDFLRGIGHNIAYK